MLFCYSADLFIFTTIFCVFYGANCANILFVVAPGSDSHRRSMYPLAHELGQRNHTVTMFMEANENLNKLPKPGELENVSLFMPFLKTEHSEFSNKMRLYITWNLKAFNSIMMFLPWSTAISTTQAMMNQKFDDFNATILSKKWDMIVVDSLFTPTGIMVGGMLKCPTVIYHTTWASAAESSFRGIPYVPSSMPAIFISQTDYNHKNFWHRFWSTISDFVEIVTNWLIDSFMYQRNLRQMSNGITIQSFFQKSKFALADFPENLDYPRITTSNTIYMGGDCSTSTNSQNHTSPSKKLSASDWEILSFVNNPGSHGTILIAFGHMVKWNSAPKSLIDAFLASISDLKDYRIVWQFDGILPENGDGKFKHVKVSPWIPQELLLKHPKTKLFVTHGGMKSVRETICAEIPVITIPFFAEQIRNGFLIAKNGGGLIVEKHDLVNGSSRFLSAILKILHHHNTYKNSMMKMRRFLIDKPILPMKNGVFWTEYFLRHKNLDRRWFTTRGADLSFFVYFCLDSYLIFGLMTVLCIVFLYAFIKLLLKLV